MSAGVLLWVSLASSLTYLHNNHKLSEPVKPASWWCQRECRVFTRLCRDNSNGRVPSASLAKVHTTIYNKEELSSWTVEPVGWRPQELWNSCCKMWVSINNISCQCSSACFELIYKCPIFLELYCSNNL